MKKRRSITVKNDGTTVILYECGTEVVKDKDGKVISIK